MLVGQQLGPFTIDRELGSGAMGAVYRARYAKTGQFVAIKVVAPGLSTSKSSLARFEREGEILKQLRHPNIVRLVATGKYQGQPFYAMEYIEGESLDKVMARRGRITWEEVVAIGRQLCAALQHAHEKGIVHRDLKPSNLMVLPDGTIKLTDFGIAKDLDVTQLTSAHCTVGTAAYMSPEQCRGERNLTSKSDLYSLGIMLYELVTGKKPFEADSPMDMFLQHVQGKFVRPSRLVLDIPVWLDTLICQLLEKKPEQRPVDAAMVAQALDQVQEKVETLKSAGVDAVQARRVDRPRDRMPADQLDMEAARALQTGLGKFRVRRRRKEQPFLEKKWVQAAGILALLALAVGALWWFSRPAGPDKLYAKARTLMESSNPDDWSQARSGPIQEYLERYAHRDDEQTHQVQAWADQEDVRLREQQLLNRRKKFEPDNDAERLARRALDFEEQGNLEDARKNWALVQQNKTSGDSDLRIWGLLGEKHGAELDEVQRRKSHLSQEVDRARRLGLMYQGQNDDERLAAEALHLETFGDLAAALARWKKLKEKHQGEKGQKPWLLLATQKERELHDRAPTNPEEIRSKRRVLVQKQLKEAEDASGTAQVKRLCNEIINLYENDPDLKSQVDSARKMLQAKT